MTKIHRTSTCLACVIGVTILSAIVFFSFPQPVLAAERGGHRGEFRDHRYGHDRFYPSRGRYFPALPREHRVFRYGGIRYYFGGGVWYRAYGPRFVVIAPPLGLIIPFLPPYYATIWVGGMPYYYANDAYYVETPGGYMVVAPPAGEVSEVPPAGTPEPPATAPPGEQMFMYPRKGQNETQQAEDRYQCHKWAVGQTHYDPTEPPGGIPSAQKNADYKRAMGACLDARGYTVK